jgi:hypothetical protein
MGMFAETAIVDYHLTLANQKNKLLFLFPFAINKRTLAISVCSKQTEISVVHQFYFPCAEFRKHQDMDMEAWRHGEMETWRLRHGYIDMRHGTWRNGDMEIQRHEDMDMETWRHGHGDMDMETWT